MRLYVVVRIDQQKLLLKIVCMACGLSSLESKHGLFRCVYQSLTLRFFMWRAGKPSSSHAKKVYIMHQRRATTLVARVVITLMYFVSAKTSMSVASTCIGNDVARIMGDVAVVAIVASIFVPRAEAQLQVGAMSNSDFSAVTTRSVFRDLGYELRCGRSGWCSETSYCALATETHEVGCCSDVAIAGWREPTGNCDVWGARDVGGSCQHALDY